LKTSAEKWVFNFVKTRNGDVVVFSLSKSTTDSSWLLSKEFWRVKGSLCRYRRFQSVYWKEIQKETVLNFESRYHDQKISVEPKKSQEYVLRQNATHEQISSINCLPAFWVNATYSLVTKSVQRLRVCDLTFLKAQWTYFSRDLLIRRYNFKADDRLRCSHWTNTLFEKLSSADKREYLPRLSSSFCDQKYHWYPQFTGLVVWSKTNFGPTGH
jgi:hypothetical protein